MTFMTTWINIESKREFFRECIYIMPLIWSSKNDETQRRAITKGYMRSNFWGKQQISYKSKYTFSNYRDTKKAVQSVYSMLHRRTRDKLPSNLITTSRSFCLREVWRKKPGLFACIKFVGSHRSFDTNCC